MEIKKEIKVGVVVLGAICLLIYGVFFLKGINLFNSNRTFYTHYKNIQALVAGSPVKLNGMQVGLVRKITIDETNQDRMIVELIISNNELNIPKETSAMLGSDLLGTSYIDLVLGESKEYFQPFDTLVPDYKYGAVELVSQKIDPIQVKVNSLLSKMDNILSVVDTVLGSNANNLNTALSSMATTMKNFEQASTELKTLLVNEKEQISAMLNNVNSITGNLKKSNDKITNMVNNFSKMSDSLSQMDISGMFAEAKLALVGANQIVNQINSGNGTLSQLIYNDTLMSNVNKMLDEATRLVENMKEHPKRYVHFSLFGKKEKGIQLDKRDEQILEQYIKDSLREIYKNGSK